METRRDSPSPVASAGIIVDTVNAGAAVFARGRSALVDVSFAVLPSPSRLTLTFVLAVRLCYANTVVSARVLFAHSHSQLRFAMTSRKASFADTLIIAAHVNFEAVAAITAGCTVARRTWSMGVT